MQQKSMNIVSDTATSRREHADLDKGKSVTFNSNVVIHYVELRRRKTHGSPEIRLPDAIKNLIHTGLHRNSTVPLKQTEPAQWKTGEQKHIRQAPNNSKERVVIRLPAQVEHMIKNRQIVCDYYYPAEPFDEDLFPKKVKQRSRPQPVIRLGAAVEAYIKQKSRAGHYSA
ncbi:hypothetical protein DdX_02945 [Ditylenchus destructor]|uniref:Uncharacterized protein n=1 Tax=Ditylenchus destructor TaxID=166010 RepID=A0AAD4NFR1_9BILA|nr:hypothetical protein DdX_02945 [Ditylenchus destructor]